MSVFDYLVKQRKKREGDLQESEEDRHFCSECGGLMFLERNMFRCNICGFREKAGTEKEVQNE